ncbi:hypothetical protein L1049_010707 [Liquidambar formosana]|uniref:DUF4408 domain-containing protein n=1 Tax=Liquidambar formosana TaxID=63359 RepID=A0AAP0NBZ7_LIQFO
MASAWILSLKVLLISTGVVSMAVILKASVPVMLQSAPVMWSSFRSWLKPPYLYVVINCIIITIAASSRFYHKHDDEHSEAVPRVPEVVRPEFVYEERNPVEISPDFSVSEPPVVYEQSKAVVSEVKAVVSGPEVEYEEDEEFVISRSTWSPPKRLDSSESLSELFLPAEKPLVSSRFGHRKPVKASPEGGKALRVSKPKRHETLENTWKAITDGRAMPLTRHHRRSDTWEHHQGRQEPTHHQMNKSETFNDRTNNAPPPSLTSSPGPVKLRKEPSLSQDELNRRVEAFIKKFNDEMRLQRQESLNQYMEMINRGAHF